MTRKKWLTLLSVSTTLLLAACGEETTTSDPDIDIEEVEEEDEVATEEPEEDLEDEEDTSTENEIVLGEAIELDDYTITIQSYELTTDYEGNDALIINFDWVNNSEETVMPTMTYIFSAFQNGVETDDVFMIDGVDLGISQREVRPEGTIEGVQDQVGVNDLSEPLELELSGFLSLDSTSYTTVLDLSSLQ